MNEYTVKAIVTVDVEMVIEAADLATARQIFDEQIMMTASLADADNIPFEVSDDSISELDIRSVETV